MSNNNSEDDGDGEDHEMMVVGDGDALAAPEEGEGEAAAAAAVPADVVPTIVGPCALGAACTAKDQELSEQYRCRFCGKQLHGFISGCSVAKNLKDFRDGVICKDQPCVVNMNDASMTMAAAEAAAAAAAAAATPSLNGTLGRQSEGAAIAAAAGLPQFLWDTQQPKRKRDPSLPKLRRQRYTKEQKRVMLDTLQSTPGAKLPDIAKQYQIPEGTLRGWFDDDRRHKAAAEAAAAAEDIGEIHENILDPPVDEGDGEDGGMVGASSAAPAAVAAAAPTTAAAKKKAKAAAAAAERPDDSHLPPAKRRRQRYSNETKIQVILALETRPNASLNDVAKEFQVAPGTVRGWREEADKIQKQAMENRRVGAKANPSRDPLRKVWDAILSLFEKNSRLPEQQRLDVNYAVVKTIGKQARDVLLAANNNKEGQPPTYLTANELQNIQKFKASDTWARKWARDHQVMTTKPETGTILVDVAQARLAALQKIVAEFSPDRVYTMTSAALFYRILPHRTYVSKVGTHPAAKRVRSCKGLKSKDRLTLYLCTNESGTDKLPVTCIGKYKNPACFQVAAQKNLPYLSQKQALNDAGTYQRWWRTVFLPHVRSQLDESETCLLLVEDTGPCKAELLKDPTGQVRVEALPPCPSANAITLGATSGSAKDGSISSAMAAAAAAQLNQSTTPALPQCQPLEFGIIETVKRRYRYRLLQEVMDAFDERALKRKVANNADFPMASRGLREGNLANVADGMRLLESIWKEVATTTIAKAWQRTKLRPKSNTINGGSNANDAMMMATLPVGQRAKSEKRQTTREKKQLVKDLNNFLTKHESRDFTKDDGANELEEMIEKLKNCFLYTDGEVIESKEMMESLEEWIGLEDSQGMVALNMEEIKTEMNIEYLVGLKEPVEGVVPEAEEGEDPQLEPPTALSTSEGIKNGTNKQQEAAARTELDLETALELASTIKTTACKLFGHGDILGELAVRLDDASDSVFRLLRQQKEMADAKEEADKAKAHAKNKAKARAAAAAAAATPVGEGEDGDDDDDDEDVQAATVDDGDAVESSDLPPHPADIGNVDLTTDDIVMEGV